MAELPSQPPSSPPRAVALSALAFYFGFFFLSPVPPGPNVLNTPADEFLGTVVDLSLNFFFVLPLTSPEAAPVNNPMYEAIFNSAIAFSLLYVGFAADGRKDTRDPSLAANAFVPFLAAMPFATNLAYLLYLGVRPPSPPDAGSRLVTQPLNALEQLGETRWLPLALTAVFLFSLGWGAFARPEFGAVDSRLDLLGSLLGSERLAYALLGDCAFFGAFQGWLLEDDLQRREDVTPAVRQRLLTIGRFVPFFGLVWYLLARPPLEGSE